jgi:uncharacterized repeat protein (TIGR01451 family)
MKTNAKNTRGRRPTPLLGALVAVTALFTLATPASALAGPVLDVSSSNYPQRVPVGTHTRYTIIVSNAGDAATSGEIEVDLTVPAGLRIVSATDELAESFGLPMWTCAIAGDSQSVSCTGVDPNGFFGGPGLPIGPGEEACVGPVFGNTCRILVTVKADSGAPTGTVTPTVTACGGGHTTCPTPGDSVSDPIEIVPFDFHITSFDGNALKQNGDPATQAGSHPHTASTEFTLSTFVGASGLEFPTGGLKDATANIPPGLVGNPQAVPTCTQQQLTELRGQCPPESQVGTVTLHFGGNFGGATPGRPSLNPVGVYNMEVPFGLPALFGFNYLANVTQVYARLRTGGDYGVTVTAKNAPETIPVVGVDFSLWGVPADPSHDARRYCAGNISPGCTSADSADPRPFISLPTSCVGEGGVPGGPVRTFLDVFSWEGGFDSDSFLSHDNGIPPTAIGADGCPALGAGFQPTLEARPTTTVADSPSGLDVDLRVPQSDDPNGNATAHLRDTTVTLPDGLVVNPSGANGLDGCSPSEIDLRGTGKDSCPPASRIASVQVETPLLENPLEGSVFVADPYDNPFNSLLALYIVVDDDRTDITVKLAGEVTPDPVTGQLSSTFENNPQLPFEHFRLHFFGGAGGALRTPAVCGDYTTTSSLTPWSAPDSGPPATSSDTWTIDQSPGGNCATSQGALPHAPSFDAGAVSPIAGVHSPFVMHLRRDDGSQNFSAVTLTPPQGLVAKLVGTAICSDGALATAAAKTGQQEKASPSCPAASEVGSVTAGAGAGPAPYYASGKAYMAGPYKGAPLSLAIVTPATAGPFDLGTVVIRTALHVNPKTAEITAVSDSIPHILQGIPLDIRTADISLDRPNFTLNPTSCDPMAVTGQLLSTIGQLANLSSRFQLGECGRLGFKPQMTLNLRGGTKRGKHPALTIALMPRPGDANIASVSVAMPRSEFLENAHIRTICTRPDFAADQCPAGAIYGEATVDTPLLDYDLAGHVYLRSSDNLLPDVVPDLRGPAYQPIKLETAGRTDSIRGGIRTTIDFVPDAPFTKATVALQGGSKGLLVNSRNICGQIYRATIRYTAHNGLAYTAHPALRANCGKRAKRRGKRRAHRR